MATEIASLADEVIRTPAADETSSSLSSLSLRADSPRSIERSPTPRCPTLLAESPPGPWTLGFLNILRRSGRASGTAASAPGQRDRLRNAVSILVNDVRVAMAGAFLTSTRRPSPGTAGSLSAADAARIDAYVERARHMHSCARMLLTDGLRLAFFGEPCGLGAGAVRKGGRPSGRSGRKFGAPAAIAHVGASAGAQALRACGSPVLGGGWPGHGLGASVTYLWILRCGCQLDG